MKSKLLDSLLICGTNPATDLRLKEWFKTHFCKVEMSLQTLLAHKNYLDAQFIDFHKNHILPKIYHEIGMKLLREEFGELSHTETDHSRTDIARLYILREPHRTVENAVLAFSKRAA